MRRFLILGFVGILSLATACGGDGSTGTECATAADCDDSDACTEDTCSAVGECEHTALVCDDGLFCNGTETCDPTSGCQVGTPPVVDDGIACTDDSCDDVAGVVVNAPNNTVCDDGIFCNGSEVCDPASDCQPGTPPVVDDGVGCTDDSCDEANGVVVNEPIDTACDDGQYCNGVETCDPVSDCQAGTPPVVDDGVGCTDDSCDEINDTAVSVPNNANCDDGQFCNGAETCDPAADCVTGTPPVVDDGVGCTDDSCDEANDVVVNAPNATHCDDGLFCNGPEVCDPSSDCQLGTPPTVDDGVGCTDDSCDEVNNVVINAENDANCDSLDVCTVDACDALADCQTTPEPTCVNCVTPIGGNGTYDSVNSLVTASGPWADQGLIDDFVLSAPDTEFCSIEFYFVPPTGSTEFNEVEIRIYDLGATGIAGLGDFTTAVPVFSQVYHTDNGSLIVSDTGDNITTGIVDGDILHYEAVGTSHDLGAGNFGLFIWFPNATVQMAGWVTAAPSGTTECMSGWGTTQTSIIDACPFVGAQYENAAFQLLRQ